MLSELRSTSPTRMRAAASSEIVPDLTDGGCRMFATHFQSVIKMSLKLNLTVRDRELHYRRGRVVAAQNISS